MDFIDRFGRRHDDLRISVTDRCNLRCTYCMPEEPVWFERDTILHYEEILRLVRIGVLGGIRKVRLTGGEPLVRRDLTRLVSMLAAEPGIEDLSLTTNGLLLDDQAPGLFAAGLRRLNVSLDTLSPERFARLTRRDRLDKVLGGLEAAVAAGMAPVKVNTVLVRGHNDDEAELLVERAREEGWELRFIEYMPLDNATGGKGWNPSLVVSGAELRERIGARWPLEPAPGADPHAPARRWRFADGGGTIGFVDSVSAPFCSTCSRLRLTADGHFRVCLYDDGEVDLKTPMRAGADDGELLERMTAAVQRKGRGGALEIIEHQSAPALRRTMHQIGG